MHLAQKPSIEIVDFDAMYHNLDSHQHYNLSIGHAQSSTSLEDRFDKHILTENVSENLAMTSRIFHLSTANHIQNIKQLSRLVYQVSYDYYAEFTHLKSLQEICQTSVRTDLRHVL